MFGKSIACAQTGQVGHGPDTRRTNAGRTRTPLFRGVRDVRLDVSAPVFPGTMCDLARKP